MNEAQNQLTLLEEKDRAYRATLEKHLRGGVHFISSQGVYIDEEVTIAPGATILPGTFLRGKTTVGAGSTIGPNSVLEDATVGEEVLFQMSQGEQCSIGDGAHIGPFVHLRPGAAIGAKVKIGNFVEVKNSSVGQGTSLAHLTYIGDTDMGAHCNIGCGVVTVNYDGETKQRTTVEDFAFVGCNANLIAPVRVGEGAYIAAGSTVTEDVPAGALAIGRAKQVNKEGWAERKLLAYRKKHAK